MHSWSLDDSNGVGLELLHLRQGRLGLGLRRRHVTLRARGLGLLHQVEGLAAGRLRPGERAGSLHILTARGLNVLTTRRLNILATRSLHVLTTRRLNGLTARGLNVLTARRLNVLATRRLHILTARRLHILTTRSLYVLTTRRLNSLTTRSLHVLTTRSLHILTARRLNVLATRRLHILTTRGLHILTTRRLNSLTTWRLNILTARGLHVLATRRLDLARARKRARRLRGVRRLGAPHVQLLLGFCDFGRALGLGLDGRRGKRGDREGAHQHCKHSLHRVPSNLFRVVDWRDPHWPPPDRVTAFLFLYGSSERAEGSGIDRCAREQAVCQEDGATISSVTTRSCHS